MAFLKGNKSLIIILPLLLIVWAGVGYKAYTLFFATERRINPNLHRTINGSKVMPEKKYEPILSYSDPFLKKPQSTKVGALHSVEGNVKYLQEQSADFTPPINFIGTISGKSGADHQAIIRFNANIKIVSMADSVGSYKILLFSNDTLLIQGLGKKWRIPLSQN